jgi:MoaA/NifB/PqqE/SkfB family radical SAM enzyme
MLKETTGITRIRMLYLQLLYQCNFSCRHCFHGKMLAAPERYTPAEVRELLTHFVSEYRLEAVALLGGEPLLYAGIAEVAADAKGMDLAVEICTNGHHGFFRRLRALAPYLDKLRVSIDGLEPTHDGIRQSGSFASALETIQAGVAVGLTVGVTTTVTRANIAELPILARLLDRLGVAELKLHQLRLVGNAAVHPDLEVRDSRSQYTNLYNELDSLTLAMRIIYDSDLLPMQPTGTCDNVAGPGWLDRIEIDPRGGLTVSCKAVGRNANAFRWDRTTREIRYEPHGQDELTLAIPDVVYRAIS